jgi:hypothetical protein
VTGTEYKIAIGCLGMNQREAAEWLGIALRTSQAYANDKSEIPTAIAKLLRLQMIHHLSQQMPASE